MASQVTNYKCPACTGPLHFVGSSGKLECDYCGSKYEVEEIEAILAEENERAAAAAAEAGEDPYAEYMGVEEGMKSYTCPSCGAQMLCEANTAATCCPYCGNQTVVPGQFAGDFRPEFLIPFRTDKEQAVEALKNHYKGKVLLPKSFVDGNHVEDIQGVYVPFWMYDCEASGRVLYDAKTVEKRTNGNTEITTTKYYDVLREGNIYFDKVPVDASARMPDGHMDSIEPFDYGELKSFSMAYMPGFLAEKYDLECDECAARAEKRVSETFVDEIDKTVRGYQSKSIRDQSIQVEEAEAHYAMLPVWLLATRWNDQSFLFAMNGQSGKLVGDLPMDKGKFWGWLGGVSAALILIMELINYFVFETPLTGVGMVAACILLPILIGVAVAFGLKSQLKSVREQRAAAYIAAGGLELTQSWDHLVRTTTESREIKK